MTCQCSCNHVLGQWLSRCILVLMLLCGPCVVGFTCLHDIWTLPYNISCVHVGSDDVVFVDQLLPCNIVTIQVVKK